MDIDSEHPSFMPSGDLFHFKQFSLDQAGCGMCIGTDGVLLGAWASIDTREETPLQILDVGCGTGLIALMLAQRYPRAEVTALEIEPTAVERLNLPFRLGLGWCKPIFQLGKLLKPRMT